MNTTTPPLIETDTLAIPTSTALYILSNYLLSSIVSLGCSMLSSILTKSLALILVIAIYLLASSIIDYILSLLGITTDEDMPPCTSHLLSILDMRFSPSAAPIDAQQQKHQNSYFLQNTTAVCMGLDFGPRVKALGLDKLGIENLCKVGLLLIVMVPKGYIERRIVYVVVNRGLSLLKGWMGLREADGDVGDAGAKVDKGEEEEMKSKG